jgi:hypothetical protein
MSASSRQKVPNVSQHGFSSFRTDLFGRIKTSEPYTIFDSTHRYQKSTDFSEESSGTASFTHLPNESSIRMSIGTASGDKATLESYRVFPYQPGKSLQIMQTFVMAPTKNNLRQRVGYFTRENGFYLEQHGSLVYLVKRSYISGEVVETRVPQSQWNIDTLNGEGPSDISLDLTKAQILWSEYEWLGVGSVRLGFAIDGFFIPVHAFHHANYTTSVYMTTASLPVRYEIENTGATASVSAFKQICSSVIANGGFFKSTETWTATKSSATVGTDYYPLVAIRMASGRTDSVIIPAEVNIFPTSADTFEWALIRNPASITGGSWVAHSPKNNVEYNTTATAISGGTEILQGFFGAQNQSTTPMSDGDLRNFSLQLGRTNASPAVSDVVVLVARVTAGTGTTKSSLGWFDIA